MIDVGVRELRQNISRWLKRVAEGETLRVTDHGKPVAMLTPLPSGDDFADRLEREGRLFRRATKDLKSLGPPPKGLKLPKPSGEILDELREERLK